MLSNVWFVFDEVRFVQRWAAWEIEKKILEDSPNCDLSWESHLQKSRPASLQIFVWFARMVFFWFSWKKWKKQRSAMRINRLWAFELQWIYDLEFPRSWWQTFLHVDYFYRVFTTQTAANQCCIFIRDMPCVSELCEWNQHFWKVFRREINLVLKAKSKGEFFHFINLIQSSSEEICFLKVSTRKKNWKLAQLYSTGSS